MKTAAFNNSALTVIALLCAIVLIGTGAGAQVPITVCDWTPYTFPVGNESQGNWAFADTCLVAIQTVECNPSVLLGDFGGGSYTVSCPFIDAGNAADDFVGFVFGYQDSSHFYLMDWKHHESDHPVYGVAEEGFSVKRILAPSVDSLKASDFWQSSGTTYSTVLASDFGEGKGYRYFDRYEFVLEFSQGCFTIVIYDSMSVLWTANVRDGSCPTGRFGFYDFSSQDVEFGCRLLDDPPCGDADGNGTVDIDDVVYLVSRVFAGGPRPIPWYSGDVDCSGCVDIDDVVYMINYILCGGNAPCDVDGDGMPDC